MAPPRPEAVYLFFNVLNEDESLGLKPCMQAFTGCAEENSQPALEHSAKRNLHPTAGPAFPEG